MAGGSTPGAWRRLTSPSPSRACSLQVSHGFAHRFPPLTVVTTNVDCSRLLDLTTEAGRAAAGTDLPTLGCASHAGAGRGPDTAHMDAREAARRGGGAGALVPSFATGATEGMRNWVLWRWGGAAQKVVAWDEEGRLG